MRINPSPDGSYISATLLSSDGIRPVGYDKTLRIQLAAYYANGSFAPSESVKNSSVIICGSTENDINEFACLLMKRLCEEAFRFSAENRAEPPNFEL